MEEYSIIDKRALVFAARMRFSPQSQVIRDIALEKIIERQLMILDKEAGVSLEELKEQKDICLFDGTNILTDLDLNNAIQRLNEKNKLVILDDGNEYMYRLSKESLVEFIDSQRSTKELIKKVLNTLFRNAPNDISFYQTPFLECLCIIFSHLGEFYVRVIKGDVDLDDLLRSPVINDAFQTIRLKYKDLDIHYFEATVLSFFEEINPDYASIKWNMAQNYYISKVIGLDPSGFLLSKEIFGDANFYLDTNVLVHALEPLARHHKSFKVLSDACKKIGSNLKVCQISLNELNNLIIAQRILLEKVANSIPAKTAPKIRSVFFKLYKEKLETNGSVDFDELFECFNNVMEELGASYDVELVDDEWFDSATNETETLELIDEIKRLYKNKRKRQKSTNSALHDALLLRWLQLERNKSNKNNWVLTLDTSLPSYLHKQIKTPGHQLAMTLDALLQWISPIIGVYDDSDENEVATIFSEAVRAHILPQERLFDLKDFLVFAEMEWETKELPSEDVEDCIRYIKKIAPELDTPEAVDREKITHEISRFFTDPGRKFKKDMQKLESEIGKVRSERTIDSDKFKKEINERDKEIEKLKGSISTLKEHIAEKELRSSAQKRLVILTFILLFIEGLIAFLSYKYGEGQNYFQKLLNSWTMFLTGSILWLMISWFILGKDRIRLLGWGFMKFFKSE
jgi:hypothetical protein